MAQYDPQRSRSRHRSGDDEGPAPVDALLESTGSTEASDPSSPPELIDLTDAAPRASAGPEIASTNGADPPAWADGPGPATRAAPLKAAVAAIAMVVGLVLAWAWLRRRRQPPAAD